MNAELRATSSTQHFPSCPEPLGERLELLTSIAGLLGIDDVSFASYATALSRLSSSELSLKRSLSRLEHVENQLRAHLASVKHEERLLKKWTEMIQSDQLAGESAATLERRKDVLLKKAEAYRKELDELTAASPKPLVTVMDLTAQQERIREKEQNLKLKRAKIRAFQGLPPVRRLLRDSGPSAQRIVDILWLCRVSM